MKKIFKAIKNFAKRCWKAVVNVAKKAAELIQKGAQWCTDHPDIVMGVSIAFEGATWGIKKLKKSRVQKEIDYQRTHIYDHSVGHHWSLRRELTSNEMLELSRRKDNGENLADILSSMRVLA